MRYLFGIIFSLYSILSFGQVQVYTKQQVDSITTVLRKEIGNIPTPEPGKDCPKPVELVSVYGVSSGGLFYNFYSEGVKRMTEKVYNYSGNIVYSHTTDPVLYDRIGITFSLPAGEYYLTVENADCKAISEKKKFIIPNSGGGGGPPPVGFINNGIYKKEVGGIIYEYIPSENSDIEIIDGRVKLIVPQTKKSFNGQNDCQLYIVGDLYDNRLPQYEESALKNTGLNLPPGIYHFKMLYVTAKTWDEFLANKWHYLGTDGNAEQRAGQPETIILSIYDGKKINGLDPNHFRVSWTPQFYSINDGLKLPKDKIFGPTRYMGTLNHDYIWNNATHIQNPGGVFNYKGPNYYWFNIQARPGTRQPDQVIRETPVAPGFVAMSELAENYGNDEGDCPNCYYKSETVFKGLYEKSQREYGAKTPYDTWLITDYFTDMNGGSIDGGFFSEGASKEERTRGLSDINYAQSYRQNIRWYKSGYFNNGWYNYRNFMSHGYLGNVLSLTGGQEIYDRIYQHEKAGLALPDRKRVTYITPQQEWLGYDYISSSGTTYKFPIEGGELIRNEAFIHSFTTFQTESFYSLLFGNGLLIWDSNLSLNPSEKMFTPSWWGGYDAWKTQFKKDGKKEIYDENNPNHPKQIKGDGIFPERPSSPEQGAYVGAKMYESFGIVYSAEWVTYSLNGKTVIAKRGKDGTTRANVSGVQNPGQDNIVLSYENSLPICLSVKSSNGEFIVFQNPQAGLTGENLIMIDNNVFKCYGNRLNVFKK